MVTAIAKNKSRLFNRLFLETHTSNGVKILLETYDHLGYPHTKLHPILKGHVQNFGELIWNYCKEYRIVQKVRGTKLSRFFLEPRMLFHEFQNI